MDEMRKQAMRFGSEVVNGFVHDVKLNEHPFRVYYGDQEILTKTIVISRGSSVKLMDVRKTTNASSGSDDPAGTRYRRQARHHADKKKIDSRQDKRQRILDGGPGKVNIHVQRTAPDQGKREEQVGRDQRYGVYGPQSGIHSGKEQRLAGEINA